jgi:hypothetical protein
MSDCVIKAGEAVEPSDPRLSDTACAIETGAIIRPPPDLTVAVVPPKPVFRKPEPVIRQPIPVAQPAQEATAVVKEAAKQSAQHVAHTAEPTPVIPAPASEEVGAVNPTTIALAAGAVALAGTAVVGSAAGGFSTLQAKLASLFGSSKVTVASAAVVTAGTIVAVKALERKMNTLESDLVKTKKEVGETASSIDRIDALLDKLGS